MREKIKKGEENANVEELVKSFPTRELRLTEQSLLHKHYEALKIVATSDSPTLVIEDDALIYTDEQIDYIRKAIDVANKENVFVNLVNAPHEKDQSTEGRLQELSIARSYTTGAYVVNPSVARDLLKIFFPYSLPIDFHYQYLFKKANIRGYSISKDGVLNGSLGKMMESTV